MNPVILKYPLDRTGKNPNNLVPGEPHTLVAGKVRAFVANHGPFFTEGIVLREQATGRVLTPNVHYAAAQLYQEATLDLGQEVCAIMVIKDPTVQSPVLFSYQVVGGEFSADVSGLQDLIDDLNIDERAVNWRDILGVPTEFPPSPHLHDAGDLYGLEYVVEALERLAQAILIGDEASHEELRKYIQTQIKTLKDLIDTFGEEARRHIADKNNPHETTKAQVGLGLVQNYAIANQLEMETGVATDKYATPQGVGWAIAKFAAGAFNDHLTDYKNPHKTTKAQVELGDVENYPPANKQEMEERTRTDRYVTPIGVAWALAQFKTTLGNGATRNFFVSTSLPTAGSGVDGDIWLRYA